MWALNPTAYKRLAPLGGIVGPLFLLLSATMAVSLFDMLLDMEKALNRHASTQRGKQVEYFTIAWNTLEGGVAVLAGAVAGSNSLVGFGIDSFIEVISGTVLLWRMSVDADVRSRERNEKLSLRVVGVCFLALAVYVGYESISDLISRKAPEHSIPGIILACVSLVVMPLLSRAK
jgi:divalent metal cation (Fe/Co/Zn/Cd) transporter